MVQRGESLRVLARDESDYMPPVLPRAVMRDVCPVVVPAYRDVRKNRKSIMHIMQLVAGYPSAVAIFLCSGKAKKEDIVALAQSFPELSYAAIDGPFHDIGSRPFETTLTAIASGAKRDVAQKRNVGLRLAQLMGWDVVMFLDDDVTITSAQLHKAMDVLRHGNAAVVGFSVRSYPDNSVVVHARRLVDKEIDSFIGAGALAVNTTSPVLSFFPRIYNEDWLFLLVYCLFGNQDTVWAGLIEQRPYDPFQTSRRAQAEEPGDILGEGLIRLAMSLHDELHGEGSLEAMVHKLVRVADTSFWEQEINTRIAFIRDTQAKIRQSRRLIRNRWRVMRALDRSLESIIGKDGRGSLQASDLAAWVHAWARDVHRWNQEGQQMPLCDDLQQALGVLGIAGRCVYQHIDQGGQLSRPAVGRTERLAFAYEPVKPRPARILSNLENTYAVENYLQSKGLGIGHIVASAERLRFDRPTAGLCNRRPNATICIVVTPGESIERIRAAVRDIIGWTKAGSPVQLVLWVYGNMQYSRSDLEAYRNRIVAEVMCAILGSNVLLCSSVFRTDSNDVDYVVDELLGELAFAYWKCELPGNHQFFVVNSRNDLLRRGTFLEFLRNEHKMPRLSLKAYLTSLAGGTKRAVLTRLDDESSLTHARLHLARVTAPRHALPKTPTAKLVKCMKAARLTWVAVDDMAFNYRYHPKSSEEPLGAVKTAVYVVVDWEADLPSDKRMTANDIITTLSHDDRSDTSCTIVVRGQADDPWESIERYRRLLLATIREQAPRMHIVLASLTYKAEAGETDKVFHKKAEAIIQYAHWLQNHNCRHTIVRREYRI